MRETRLLEPHEAKCPRQESDLRTRFRKRSGWDERRSACTLPYAPSRSDAAWRTWRRTESSGLRRLLVDGGVSRSRFSLRFRSATKAAPARAGPARPRGRGRTRTGIGVPRGAIVVGNTTKPLLRADFGGESRAVPGNPHSNPLRGTLSPPRRTGRVAACRERRRSSTGRRMAPCLSMPSSRHLRTRTSKRPSATRSTPEHAPPERPASPLLVELSAHGRVPVF